jgi:hypothetical protein
MVAPEIRKIAAEVAGKYLVAKVNTEEVPSLARRYRITAIPTMAFQQRVGSCASSRRDARAADPKILSNRPKATKDKRKVMPIVAEKEIEHLSETRGIDNPDHDVIHALSKRLDALWRYDQYIANAEGYPELEKFWRDLKRQDQDNVNRRKKIVAKHAAKGCF